MTAWLLTAAPEAAMAQLLGPLDGPAATLDRTAVPAAGKHRAVLTVHRFGRYAITVESAQGVALRLVDRMTGPGVPSGSAGTRDGRLDVFLDRGQYLVRTQGASGATGDATLHVRAFEESQENPTPQSIPQLVELKPVIDTLEDFEQRSFWLPIETSRWVHLEAAGRHLRDLRLWRDGTWLHDAQPTTEVLEPREGLPLLACRLAVRLEPGLYLLTAYGGLGQPWANADRVPDAETQPLHLRMGIPTLGIAGRTRFEVSPFGIDRWRVPSKANFYRLELPEARLATLGVDTFQADSAFRIAERVQRIEKTSRVPTTEILHPSDAEGHDLVTVQAEAGQPYVLQHFESVRHYSFKESGQYWLSTVHSGHASDAIEATSILSEWTPRGLEPLPRAEQTIVLGDAKGWSTRANLLETLTVFLRIEDTGSYTLASQGTEAKFRIEPFFVHRPQNYSPPPFQTADSVWELDAGFHVLTVVPEAKGILDIAIEPTGLFESLRQMVGGTVEQHAGRAASRYPALSLRRQHRYRLHLNHQPEVRTGVVLRRLPMDLDEPLPLTLHPSESVEIPFAVGERTQLTGVTEYGETLELQIDGGPWQTHHTLEPGEYVVTVRHMGDSIVVGTVRTVPVRRLATAPLPPLPAESLEALPDFPVLTAAAPHFFDLGRDDQRTFLVHAEDDALYRLETTGLLDTAGTVRSRVTTSLANSTGGGSGRNFFLHQYLNAGDYQLGLRTEGRSAGHLGVELTRTEPIDGGVLREGLPARIHLGDGESVLYRFTLDEPGHYRLRAFTLGGIPDSRLEDADGWPLARPGHKAYFDQYFEAGTYRFLLLPESVPGRRLTLLERVAERPETVGHGPHPLPLDVTVEHRWLEPEDGQERLPDRWLFELPGATDVTLRLTGEMHGRILRLDDDGVHEAAYVPPMRGFEGFLEAGRYRLEIECLRRNHRVDYELSIVPKSLLPGLARTVRAPVTLPVAVDGGLVEITSLGSKDVRARLLDAAGRTVAHSDDRANDWNFHLAGQLDAGTYTLRIDPVGSETAETRVRLDARRRVDHGALAPPHGPPLVHTFEPGTDVHTFPLRLPTANLLAVAAHSAETLGLALEEQCDDGSWNTLALETGPRPRILLPLGAQDPHVQDPVALRLRVWSVDRRENPIRLTLAAFDPVRLSEEDLARGVSPQPVDGFEPALAVAAVDLSSPGMLRSPAPVAWSGTRGVPLRTADDGLLQALDIEGWIALEDFDRSTAKAPLRASRVRLGDEPLQLPMAPGGVGQGTSSTVELAPGPHGILLARVRTVVGSPALRLVPPGGGRFQDARTAGLGERAAVAVALGDGQPPHTPWSVDLWLAEPSDEAVDGRLTVDRWPAPEPEAVGHGRWTGSVEGPKILTLPPGNKHLRLSASPGVVVAVAQGDEVLSVHWADRRPLAERLVSVGDRLILLGGDEAPGRYSVDVLPAGGEHPAVTQTTPLDRLTTTAGTLHIEVAPGDPNAVDDGTPAARRLYVSGALNAVFQGDDGRVLETALSGETAYLPVGPAGGVLRLEHGAEASVTAWLGHPDDPTASLFAGARPVPIDLQPPAQIPLVGPSVALALDFEAPRFVEFRSHGTGPRGRTAFRLETPEGVRGWVAAHPGTFPAYLPAGRSILHVHGLGEKHLDHTLEVVAVPVATLDEGPGSEILLAPGESRAFRVTLDMAGHVGVGIQSDSSAVECELTTLDGESLGRGPVQMHDLQVGDYLLIVRLPATAEAARARPAVVGLEKPPSGPPTDVVRRYLAMAGR